MPTFRSRRGLTRLWSLAKYWSLLAGVLGVMLIFWWLALESIKGLVR